MRPDASDTRHLAHKEVLQTEKSLLGFLYVYTSVRNRSLQLQYMMWRQVSKLATLVKNLLPGLACFYIRNSKNMAPPDTHTQKRRAGVVFVYGCPREESNLDQELRSLLFYPLNYEDAIV